MNERENYIRRIFETALYFHDMYEEGWVGDTMAIELLKPLQTFKNTAVREFVLGECYKKRQLNLTEAAMQLAAWQPSKDDQLPFSAANIDAELRALCHAEERAILQEKPEQDEIINRAFLRAARYINRIHTEGAPAHSRVVEFFIPDDFVPRGKGKNGIGHKEHVVPCVLLRDKSIELFKSGASIAQVAHFLKPYVVIIEITKQEQEYLDGGKSNGGMNMKVKMPAGWEFESGCIFQRLHDANIAFEPPNGFSHCSH